MQEGISLPESFSVGHPQHDALVNALDRIFDEIRALASGLDRGTSLLSQTPGSLTAAMLALDGVIWSLRLQSSSILFQKAAEAVSELARTFDLKVDLETGYLGGAPTSLALDSSELDGLWRAALHCLRNSFAHGFELPADRVAAGKATVCKLRLGVGLDDFGFFLQIEDDGRGPSPAQCGDLGSLLSPQISTSTLESSWAGRGMGLAAAQSAAAALSGSVAIAGEPGVGFKVTVRFVPKVFRARFVRLTLPKTAVHLGSNELSAPGGCPEIAVLESEVDWVRWSQEPMDPECSRLLQFVGSSVAADHPLQVMGLSSPIEGVFRQLGKAIRQPLCFEVPERSPVELFPWFGCSFRGELLETRVLPWVRYRELMKAD